MRLLILSFYYPPDLSAGSFRTSALALALRALNIPDLQIDIVTTQPNRYSNALQNAPDEEKHEGLRIRRLTLPAHKSGMKDQARAFASFAKNAWYQTRGEQWDVVFATSSRLMTAALGAAIARRQKAPLYLDIRDLFSDTMSDVLQNSRARHVLPLIKVLEKSTFQRAEKINVVSEGFIPYLAKIAPDQNCSTFTNGIDPIFLETDFKAQKRKKLPRLLYAGNLGEGQGLHRIIPVAATALEGEVQIRIIGGGGQADTLVKAVRKSELSPETVDVLPPVPRQGLLEEYREADILFLHLNSYQAFLKVLPSKIFEYAATGKPIVAGVAGHAADFLRQHVPGAIVFDPCNVEGMVAAVRRASELHTPVVRDDFCTNFARNTIMSEMALDIIKIKNSAGSTNRGDL